MITQLLTKVDPIRLFAYSMATLKGTTTEVLNSLIFLPASPAHPAVFTPVAIGW